MPKFHVTEIRAFKAGYLVEAEDAEDAKKCDNILDENETDSWGHELLSVEEVGDDEEFAPEL